MKPAVHLPRESWESSHLCHFLQDLILCAGQEKRGLQLAGLFLPGLSAPCAVVGTQGLAIAL